jgi:LysR family transcriptional regulator for bpeEF and oprC
MHTGRYREWQFVKDGKTFAKTVSGRLNINNSDSLLEAAVAGLGIVMISNFIAAEALRSQKLRAVLTEYAAVGPQVSAIYRPNKNLSPRVRAFIDFLSELVNANPHWSGSSRLEPLQFDAPGGRSEAERMRRALTL